MNQTWCNLSTPNWKSSNIVACLPYKLPNQEIKIKAYCLSTYASEFPSSFVLAKQYIHRRNNTMVGLDKKSEQIAMSAGFYKRHLPSPPAIELSSSGGKVSDFFANYVGFGMLHVLLSC